VKRTTPLKAKKPLKRSGRIKSKPRKPSAFARIYGSQERARIMRLRPCDTCGRRATTDLPNTNSHVGPEGSKGTGYKAGWEWVITQCFACHRALGYAGSVERFDAMTGKDHRAIARRLAEEIPVEVA
jgi:hypothetical protein